MGQLKEMKMKKINVICFLIAVSMFWGGTARADDNDSALESYNRTMYDINTTLDDYIMKPLAKGYRAITTPFIRERVRNFFSNLREPASAINHTLQGNLAESGNSVGRFAVNSTLGLLGAFDVANGWGLKKNRTGLDETLAKLCVPDGPFIVLPFFGPSTPRNTVGMVGDALADPIYWGKYYATFSEDWERYSFYYGLTALGFVSLREENLEFLDDLTSSSVDVYGTIKSAFIQNRLKLNVCADKDAADAPASYDFDFDDDEDY